MRNIGLKFLFICIPIGFLLGCQKDTSFEKEPVKEGKIKDLPPSKFSVSLVSVSGDSAKITWSGATDPESQQVLYAVYLNGQIQVSGYRDSTYTFKKLKELTDYAVKVVASDPQKNEVAESIKFSTLKYWLKFLKKINYGKLLNCGGLVKANDGGYIIAGKTRINSGEEFYAIKIDTLGNVVWQKSYGELIDDYDHMKLVRSIDGYLISTGKHIIKINNAGDLKWTIKPQFFDDVFGICTDDSGNVYAAGDEPAPDGGGQVFGTISKYDTNGKLIWHQKYGMAAIAIFYDLVFTSDKQLAVTGVVSGAIHWSFFVLKIDLATGYTSWIKNLETTEGFNGRIIETTKGDFAVSGFYMEPRVMPALMLQVVDKNGNLKWNFLGKNDHFGLIKGLVETHDNSIIVFGATIFSPYYQDFGLYKFDYTGKLKWQKTYFEDLTSIRNEGVIPTDDGGYLIAATKADRSSYSGIPTEIYIFKTDDEGNFD